MIGEVPVLETARLVLRPPRLGDFDAYARFSAEPDAVRFVGGTTERTLAWRSFIQVAGAWELQGFSMFSVLLKATGEWIGRVGPWMPAGWPGSEIGWGIAAAHCRQGLATEAAAATIDWAFATLGWDEVIHAIAPDNVASQHVAAKLGSSNRGPDRLPPPFDDQPIEIWGQTRDEWFAR